MGQSMMLGKSLCPSFSIPSYSRWLGLGRQADLRRLREARGTARRAIREAKNTWFLRKAEDINRERFGGKKVWKE